MKKTIITSLLLCFIFLSAFTQEYNVPQNYKFDTKESYKDFQNQILKTIEWSLTTPLNEKEGIRKEGYAFFMAWLTGTPDVSVTLDDNAAPIFKTNKSLLMPFIMGWTKYSLENNTKDYLQCFKAGVETSVAFYEKNINLMEKDKEIEKYKKLIEKGKLEETLKKKLKTN